MEDHNAIHILPVLSLKREKCISDILSEHAADQSGRIVQKFLAAYMTKLVHGVNLASEVELLSNIIFSKKDPSHLLSLNLDDLLDSNRFRTLSKSTFPSNQITSLQMAKIVFPEMSNSQIKNMIKSGGLRMNHRIISPDDTFYPNNLHELFLFSYGKSSFYVVKIK